MFLSSTRVLHAFRFIIFLRRCPLYTHHCRGWTLPRCVHISPSSIDASSCISSPFPTRNLLNLPHSAITVTHTRSPLSPLFLNPRTPLKPESHYNDFLSCLLPSPLPPDLAFVIWRLESKSVPPFLLRYTPSLIISQTCVSIWACLLFAFRTKAAHKRSVFWISVCSRVRDREIVKRQNVQLA